MDAETKTALDRFRAEARAIGYSFDHVPDATLHDGICRVAGELSAEIGSSSTVVALLQVKAGRHSHQLLAPSACFEP